MKLKKSVTKMFAVLKVLRMKPVDVIARQPRQLMELVQFARAHSPYYQHLYHDLPVSIQDIQQLPIVTKPELMANFDGWSTDRAITRESADQFFEDKTLVGHLYLGKYFFCTTSGSTGHRGIFVQDPEVEYPYRMLNMLQSGMLFWDLLRKRIRWVTISSTGDHFGSVSGFTWLGRARKRSILLRAFFSEVRVISVQTPLPELIAELDEYRPTVVFGYATVIANLAEQQLAGRLHINPFLVSLGGEWIPPTDHQKIADAFPCLIRDGYSTAECPYIAYSCKENWLHVCSERVIVEAVDEEYQPVPAGQPSYTVLITNLINHIQPIIRYDLGDSVTVRPDACPCGNPYQAIRVMGRKNDTTRLTTADGEVKAISPMVFISLLDTLPGILRYQVIQVAPERLQIRLSIAAGTDTEVAWQRVMECLSTYFTKQGITSVTLERSPDLPAQDPRTGKFYHVRVQMAVPQN